jgi:TrmH family RNA methyltransferase
LISKQQIKYIRQLQQKKYRDENDVFLAEGFKIVNEAIHSDPGLLKNLIYTDESKAKVDFQLLRKNTILTEVNPSEFSRITLQSSPQELMAILKKPKKVLPPVSRTGDLSIVLDKLQDPGNFGTIIRLADWFGIHHIFCSPDTVDCYNQKVVQSSMGAIFRVSVHYIDPEPFLKKIKEHSDQTIYGTSLNGQDLFSTDLSAPAIILFGNESGGISGNVSALTDKQLSIPHFSLNKNRTESLNVSVAAAIICSEFRRRHGGSIQNGTKRRPYGT